MVQSYRERGVHVGRAVIYTRVSTRAQEDGYSLGTQEADGRAYCAKQEHTVVGVESDTFTGHDSLQERIGMQNAIRMIRRGEADTLVIWKVDRAGRFMIDNLQLLQDVSEAGGSWSPLRKGLSRTRLRAGSSCVHTALLANKNAWTLSRGLRRGRPHVSGKAISSRLLCRCSGIGGQMGRRERRHVCYRPGVKSHRPGHLQQGCC